MRDGVQPVHDATALGGGGGRGVDGWGDGRICRRGDRVAVGEGSSECGAWRPSRGAAGSHISPHGCLLTLSDERDHAASHLGRLRDALAGKQATDGGGGGGGNDGDETKETKGAGDVEAAAAALNDAPAMKKLMFTLDRQLRSQVFSEEFIGQGGMPLLVQMARESKGNTQAYALQATSTCLSYANGIDYLSVSGQSLVKDLTTMAMSPSPNVARIAVGLLSTVSRFADQGFDLVDSAVNECSRTRHELPYASIVRQVRELGEKMYESCAVRDVRELNRSNAGKTHFAQPRKHAIYSNPGHICDSPSLARHSPIIPLPPAP